MDDNKGKANSGSNKSKLAGTNDIYVYTDALMGSGSTTLQVVGNNSVATKLM